MREGSPSASPQDGPRLPLSLPLSPLSSVVLDTGLMSPLSLWALRGSAWFPRGQWGLTKLPTWLPKRIHAHANVSTWTHTRMLAHPLHQPRKRARQAREMAGAEGATPFCFQQLPFIPHSPHPTCLRQPGCTCTQASFQPLPTNLLFALPSPLRPTPLHPSRDRPGTKASQGWVNDFRLLQ